MNHSNDEKTKLDQKDRSPEPAKVLDYLLYGLSLPERAIRSTTAVVGGAIRESASYLVPQAFRDSRSYRTFVTQMLDLMAHDIGGVKSAEENSAGQVEGYVARKTASQFVELAGLATLHVSPLVVLAVISDVAFGSTSFLRELSDELKREGVIAESSTIDSTSDLLEAISELSGKTAGSLDLPPLSVEGLRKTIQETTDSIRKADPTLLIPQAEVQRMWGDLQAIAGHENANLLQVSGAISLYALNQVGAAVDGALTTVRVTGNLIDRHILDHYRSAASEIWQDGMFAVTSRVSAPYVEALWYNFASDRRTVTADLLTGRLAGQAWQTATGWWRKNPEVVASEESPETPP